MRVKAGLGDTAFGIHAAIGIQTVRAPDVSWFERAHKAMTRIEKRSRKRKVRHEGWTR
jgi:hypothetical protein